MTIRKFSILFTFAVGIIGAANAHACAEPDPLDASFERIMSHQPAPAIKPVRESINNDVLYRLVNKPLQSSDVDSRIAASKPMNEDETREPSTPDKGSK